MECCGNESFLDWPQNAVPSSCFRSQVSSVHEPAVGANNVYEIGCSSKLRSIINNNFTTVGVATSAIALFPLFGSILSFGLSMINELKYYNN
ncbi:hypothetical protein DOY81_011663 [Sarcophaga bullata]|nr:hypothetical protein DOY81_011663 [Sarcophaga bullata]